MYIFVKASLPSHKMVAVAHGVLICHKIYLQDPEGNGVELKGPAVAD